MELLIRRQDRVPLVCSLVKSSIQRGKLMLVSEFEVNELFFQGFLYLF
jgi:hypothetical protein